MTRVRIAEADWNARPLPVVDERRCSGCGWCAKTCPTGALAMDGALPMLVRPTACVSCGVCVDVCPTDAIALHTRPV